MSISFAQLTQEQPHRPILEKAVSYLNSGNNRNELLTAIDCGCGAGNESAYLLKQGFRVYAFDNDLEAVNICQNRFKYDRQLQISQTSFEKYVYPKSHLVIALYSLFFCPAKYLMQVIHSITECLNPNGLLVMNLLGHQDQWFKDRPDKFSAFTTAQILDLFQPQYNICLHEVFEGEQPLANGTHKFWHTHMLILQKKPKPCPSDQDIPD